MELIDCHSHSAFSGHGQGTVEDAVIRAAQLGLTTYAQTEHLVLPETLDPHHDCSMSASAMEQYCAKIALSRDMLHEMESEMELICGIEADWLDGRADDLKKLCAPFEYVLGSVHFVDGMPIDDARFPQVWEQLGVDGVWRCYFEKWLDMAASDAPIDCFAHPDLPKKYGDYPSFDLQPYYHAMAEAAAQSGHMVEVNTAGLRKAVGEIYPGIDLLHAFYEAGVDCTIGCDAHCPQDIAYGVPEAYVWMCRAGYSRLTVPTRDHDRRYIEIKL